MSYDFIMILIININYWINIISYDFGLWISLWLWFRLSLWIWF